MEIRTEDLPVPVQMKIFRMLAGISALEMARRWGRSQAYVYRVERGDTAPMPLEYLDAQVLGAEAYMTAARSAVIDRASGESSNPSGETQPDRPLETADLASAHAAERGGRRQRRRRKPPSRSQDE